MAFNTLVQKAAKYVVDHSPTILTGVSVVAAAATVYAASKASFNLGKEVEVRNRQELEYNDDPNFVQTPRELAEYLHQSGQWKEYLPAVGLGLLTVAAIVGSDKIHRNRQAGITAAFALTQRSYLEYREKVIEKLGERKHQQILAEVAQDRVNQELLERPGDIPDNREKLCYDKFSGHWFDASEQEIDNAENQINSTLVHANFASLADLYSMLGIPITPKDHECGWHHDNGLLKIDRHHSLMDNIPCIVIDFVTEPARGHRPFH